MKKPTHSPQRVTLADIQKDIDAGRIAYLYAVCGWWHCRRRHVPLDQAMLLARLGGDFPFKAMRLKCSRCVAEGRDPYQVQVFPRWRVMEHVTGRHPGHHTPNTGESTRRPITIIKKRRRKKSSFPVL